MKNSKRQTVWLVSMLGLMVVLSAYYLFSDPVEDLQTAGGDNNDAESSINISGDMIDPTAILDQIGVTHEGAKTDEEIIAEYEASETMSQDFFITSYMNRMEMYSEQFDELYQVIDNPNATDEEIYDAYEAVGQLEAQQNIIADLEEQIMANHFEDVLISSDGEGSYIINVKTEKLESSEFVSIVDLVIGELGVRPADVKVQYRTS